jgi:hypothetical protein
MTLPQNIPIDVSLGQPIAHGRTADIYAWKDGYILKLFHNWFDLNSIQFEAKIANAVQASGLPVPCVGAIVQIDGRNGLIYEQLNGWTMLEALFRKPWRIWYYARRQAALHVQMHTLVSDMDLPSQRHRLENKIHNAMTLSTKDQSTVLSLLNALPDGNRVCHGDFHPGNIFLTHQNEIIIDWYDAALGNPIADLTRSSIIILGSAASDLIPDPFMKQVTRLFHTIYLQHYFNLRPGGELEYQCWLPIVAAARLSENIPELENWLVIQVQKVL